MYIVWYKATAGNGCIALHKKNLISESFPGLRNLLSLMDPARKVRSVALSNKYWGLVADENAKFRGAEME